jgi:hypothetical protein
MIPPVGGAGDRSTQRVLLDDGKPLRLGSRALDILISLVERAAGTNRNDPKMKVSSSTAAPFSQPAASYTDR